MRLVERPRVDEVDDPLRPLFLTVLQFNARQAERRGMVVGLLTFK